MRHLAMSIACIGAVLLMASAASAQPEEAWAAFDGLPIVEVELVSREIFEAQAAERNLLYAWANALHIRTHASVIERELLFAEGDAFNARLVGESARNLRRIGIFQDVLVEVSRRDAGVRVRVVTDDAWSTRVIADLSSKGSILRLRLGLEDINFLGRAFRLGGSVVASNDVDAVGFGISDPRLFGTRWQGRFRYAADELALLNEARLQRPFFSEQARWTAELDYRSVRGERRLFAPGGVTRDTLDVAETFGEAFVALHARRNGTTRIGLLFSRRSLSRDVDGDQAGVALIWSHMRRAYASMRDIDRYDTSEDIGTGWTLQLGAGADLEALGGRRNRPFWRTDAAWSTFVGPSTLLGAAARHHGFANEGRMENARVAMETWGFWKQSAPALLAWNFGYSALVREPEYLQLTLGGDTRLRGYEARHDVGARALYASLEERVFSNLHLLFLRFGATLFVDAAQAWEPGESPRWKSTWLAGGVGLRIGNRKSGTGITRLDFAFGRNSFEISLSGGSFFRAGRGMEYLPPSLVR